MTTTYKIARAANTGFETLKPYVAACIWAVLGTFSPIVWVKAVLTFGSVVHFGCLLSAIAVRRLAPTDPQGRREDAGEEVVVTGGGINSSIAAQHAQLHGAH